MGGLLKMTKKRGQGFFKFKKRVSFSISMQTYQAAIEYTYENTNTTIASSSGEK